MNLKETAFTILQSAISAVKPATIFSQKLQINENKLYVEEHCFDLTAFENIYIIGAGKASAYMAQAMEDLLGNRISSGCVTVKYDHGVPCQIVKIREAGHPLPDENALQATEEILKIAQKVGVTDLVICLISGGGSALMEKLPQSIPLADLQATSQQLLACGATIQEVNTIRKHLSLVKGGQLAKAIFPAVCVTLIISDVIGDSLESIASGPTAPDFSSFSDALDVIQKYQLEKQLPSNILNHIQSGVNGIVAETLKPDDPVFKSVYNCILGNNLTALQSAEKAAVKFGFNTLILSSQIQGEAREAARVIAGIIKEVIATGHPLKPPACILFGGETTVTIRGTGKGGRNQEFALAALQELKAVNAPYSFLCCGTDGTDGPTDAAGAFVSPEICQAAEKANLNPERYLNNNDAYHFFGQINGLIKTGPTGTNVMDTGIALVG